MIGSAATGSLAAPLAERPRKCQYSRKEFAGLSRRARRINMKQNSRKDLQKRKRQKKRVAMKKYLAEKKSKPGAA
jgi:hypothetical protein